MTTQRRKNIAIVLAGGTGTRAGLGLPKQFFLLKGKTVLAHSVSRFEAMDCIDEIAIVSHQDHRNRVEEIVRKSGWTKVAAVLLGGKERYDSSLAAIRHYSGQDVNLFFHDAARPLVCAQVVSRLCTALEEGEAAAAGLSVVDTIWQTEGGQITAIPDRTHLWRAQTPQAFRLSVIERAYAKALADPLFSVTDDCGVVLHYLPEISVQTIVGAEQTLKLTYPTDISLLEKWLEEE